MIGTRNIIVHGYDQVKPQIVWEILQRDLESLKSKITKILDWNNSKMGKAFRVSSYTVHEVAGISMAILLL
jgi:hypothetical protein